MSMSDYNRAMDSIKRGLTAAQGAGAAEAAASTAYQGMVREGIAPQIKAKYRKGKHLKQVR